MLGLSFLQSSRSFVCCSNLVLVVASEQADPAVGVGSQVLPIPMKDCGSKCGESGGLLDGGQVIEKT